MSVIQPVPWTVFICLLVASCARSALPTKQSGIPVVNIPFADEMPRENFPPEPDPYPNGDTRAPEERWADVTERRSSFGIECVYFIAGDTRMYSRRILALAEAWRMGLGADSIRMSCYTMRVDPPDLP